MTQVGEGSLGGTQLAKGDEDPDYKVPRRTAVQLYVYVTTNGLNSSGTFDSYARKAGKMLREHRFELHGRPGLPGIMTSNYQIEWEAEGVDVTLHDHKLQLMALSQKVVKTPEDALPVILCTITDDVGDNGEKLVYDGRPFLMIYGNHWSADDVTLLHEIGHAAHCTNHPPWGLGRPDKRYSFMATPGEFRAGSEEAEMIKKPEYHRNTMFKKDVTRVLGSPFTTGASLSRYPKLC